MVSMHTTGNINNGYVGDNGVPALTDFWLRRGKCFCTFVRERNFKIYITIVGIILHENSHSQLKI